ncbi:uncharacterized protein LOC124606548 [Schistocerca americana]|uniref:uncharacterized protein LOC124606548 n=1 Tax=Schistocerca americana TaxID=7009 RepID=UPI001F5013BE|nr:uncharacterized protein LOC124606548 [Schistocerca americana]
MLLGFPITRADYFRLAADKLTDEKQKPFDVWRSILSSAVTHCTEEDKLNNKMCVHLCSKLMVYLKKDLNQQQGLYISKFIRVLGETVPWKDVTSHLVHSLADIDCHMELLDEPCEQMSGIIDVLLSLYNHRS